MIEYGLKIAGRYLWVPIPKYVGKIIAVITNNATWDEDWFNAALKEFEQQDELDRKVEEYCDDVYEPIYTSWDAEWHEEPEPQYIDDYA